MIMTEEEARKKACPHLSPESVRGPYGHHERYRPARCIASECMAWRQRTTGGPYYNDTDEIVSVGYCGLAGKPE